MFLFVLDNEQHGFRTGHSVITATTISRLESYLDCIKQFVDCPVSMIQSITYHPIKIKSNQTWNTTTFHLGTFAFLCCIGGYLVVCDSITSNTSLYAGDVNLIVKGKYFN